MVFLRGYLYVSLIEAENLPDTDPFGNLNKSDPLAKVELVVSGEDQDTTTFVCKTVYKMDTLNPVWNEDFRIPICHDADYIRVSANDNDFNSDDTMGQYQVAAEDLVNGEQLDGWYDLSGCDGKIHMKMSYISKHDVDMTFEVPDCYFPMRENCLVHLYQDAHCPALPIYENITSPSGDAYEPGCAWIDLYNSINNAKNFIYMTGWSINPETVLVREDVEGIASGETLGKLLKRKSEEDGVNVLLLVWNEKLSNSVRTSGFMNTHDEELKTYFASSEVEVAAVPRNITHDGIIKTSLHSHMSDTIFSHHQKTVIVDADPAEGCELRRIVAYVGGLDVTDGRYDTPEHPLFRDDTHKDFYNGCLKTSADVGPRQPWHDIHSKVEGPIAMDILNNFRERWKKQVNPESIKFDEEDFDTESPACVDDENAWNVQLFRSITADSADFFPDTLKNNKIGRGNYVDDSIHHAYVHQIRNADKFIYIENQYFMGSAHLWFDHATTASRHIIPAEITYKIIEKINAGEHFCAYIVVPMFPEGNPASMAVQEMLHWQRMTMEMMYRRIAAAIAEHDLPTSPRDYLSFYCLGKRQAATEEDSLTRHMIYVHSKMMIVDDDYIIVGSANINQRSMGGSRDSEIAVGCFQPLHTRETAGGLPRGQVHTFRTALWAEHLGSCFNPEVHGYAGSLACMQAVNQAADANWEEYVGVEPPLHSPAPHLLPYPVRVTPLGCLEPLVTHATFPDTQAAVLGGASMRLPNKLTT